MIQFSFFTLQVVSEVMASSCKLAFLCKNIFNDLNPDLDKVLTSCFQAKKDDLIAAFS